ncbi:hypothetical protein PHYBOEH_002174 [Phytophthora boehmeriae]|uniref:Uncharacterized protein n=1 Tax=Phytophthora boehmeriae TaxID=109152 RepID=A0A8T1WTI4_9STRA|nr:hypothetical protein PHYBOEH_002174 [Phytophthora boehmeriae]
MASAAVIAAKQGNGLRWRWLSWRVAAVGIVGATLVLNLLLTYKPHFKAHVARHHILRNLQQQPAIRLSFQLKRKAMYVHGASNFDVVAVPHRTESAQGDAFAFDGVTTFKHNGATHEYLLADRNVYYTHRAGDDEDLRVSCVSPSFVPPIATVLGSVDAATTATHLVEAETAEMLCPGGSLLQFSFSNDEFLLCSQHDKGFKILGEDLDVDVQYEQSAPVVMPPRVPVGASLPCDKIPEINHVLEPTASVLARSMTEWTKRSLRAQKAEAWYSFILPGGSSDCSCRGAQRDCVFVAGLGSNVDHGLTESSPKSYFGDDVEDHAPCCNSIKYITLATDSSPWTDPGIQLRMADLLAQVSATSDNETNVIKDTIIFAHSSASIILAGALGAGYCTLDPSTTWVAAAGPFMGSMGSNFLRDTCDGDPDGAVGDAFAFFGGCPANNGSLGLVYENESYSTDALNQAYADAQAIYGQGVNAVLCSDSYSGLWSLDKVKYEVMGRVLPHKSSENDGVVEYQSCIKGLDSNLFSRSLEGNRFYRAKLNHVDTSFRNGDGLFDDAKKPLKWFQCLL